MTSMTATKIQSNIASPICRNERGAHGHFRIIVLLSPVIVIDNRITIPFC
jgi:hypothetical protein